MNRSSRSVGALGLAALTVCGCSRDGRRPAATPQEAAEQAAIQIVRDRIAPRGAELTVVASARAFFADSGRSALVLKIRDAQGKLHGVALDDALHAVDLTQLADANRAARIAHYGALDAALAARIGESPNERFPVIVWIVDRSRPQPSRPAIHGEPLSAARVDEMLSRNETARAAALAAQITPVLERLRRVDPAARADSGSPAIVMTAGADALRTLARDPDIERISLALRVESEMGDVANQTTGLSSLQVGGLKGDGVKVAMTEEGGRVEPGSLLLNPIVQDVVNVCPAADAHTTEVAGLIVGRRINAFGQMAGLDGGAPKVQLRVGGSCTGSTPEEMAASSRAASWGARVISMSWGADTQNTPSDIDRFYDDIVFNRWRTVVKSAGNRGCMTPGVTTSGPGSGMTTTPGLGFNVIAVGGFDDRNTPAWSDDTMYVCSSFANPVSIHSDRQKPEIVAPAVNLSLITTGPANMTTDSGTSGASPIVASAAALMIEKNSRLSVWPEIIRAVLMATATHNIEGSARLSDKDGAGGLNAGEAVSLGQDSQRTGGRWYTCDNSTPDPLPLATLAVGPQTRHRMVISWDVDPTWSDYPNEPSADLDLEVVDANGTLLRQSISFDNTNEIVDFNTVLPTTLTMRAVRFRCDLPTWLGWAWHTTPIGRTPR